MPKWLRIAALLAVVVVVVVVATNGGGSSGWSSGDVSKVESLIANKITEGGGTPTKTETACAVKGLESVASASEVLENAAESPQKKEEMEKVAKDCLGSSALSGSSSAESPISGPACQEDLSSSACREEATQKENEIAAQQGFGGPEQEQESYESEEGSNPEGSETENEGLNEMNQELQEEYENGEVTGR